MAKINGSSGRKGLRGLPTVPRRWRPDRAKACQGKYAMESRAKAKAEDCGRGKASEKALAEDKDGLLPAREVRRLTNSFKCRTSKKRCDPSLASMVSMRRTRVMIAGWLWKLFRQRRWGRAATVHIAPASWEIPFAELLDIDPRRLLAELRAALYRDGAAKADGYLILFLDGEFDPTRLVFRLHVHGQGAGGMLAAADRLRFRKNFESHKPDPARVVIRFDVGRLPRCLTYLLKPDWFAVWRGIKKDGTKGKSRKRRIKEPYGTLFRVWLNRWTIDDICLRIHLTVGAQGFVVTSKVPYKNGGAS